MEDERRKGPIFILFYIKINFLLIMGLWKLSVPSDGPRGGGPVRYKMAPRKGSHAPERMPQISYTKHLEFQSSVKSNRAITSTSESGSSMRTRCPAPFIISTRICAFVKRKVTCWTSITASYSGITAVTSVVAS